MMGDGRKHRIDGLRSALAQHSPVIMGTGEWDRCREIWFVTVNVTPLLPFFSQEVAWDEGIGVRGFHL